MENLLTMDFLPPATEGRLPLLRGVLPALRIDVSAVKGGLAALPRVASSLHLTEATLSEAARQELLGGVAGAGSSPPDEGSAVLVAAASLCAMASWRACATPIQSAAATRGLSDFTTACTTSEQ